MEVGNNYIQAENYDEMPCSIMIQKNLMVIVEDDDGAKSYVPMVFDGIEGGAEGYSPVSPLDVQDTYYSAFGIPQTDIDWVTGATSSCPSYPSFSLADHADTIGTGTAEHIVTVTLDDAGDWSPFSLKNTMDGVMITAITCPHTVRHGSKEHFLPQITCERYDMARRSIFSRRLHRLRY